MGFGGAAVSANRNTIGVHVPLATAISDVAEARRDYMDESGGATCRSSPTVAWAIPAVS